jgi:hypothetical protein
MFAILSSGNSGTSMLTTEKTFDLQHLDAMCKGSEFALVVKRYADQTLCAEIAKRVRDAIEKHRASGSSIYVTDAIPFFNAIENDERYKTYFSTSLSYMRHMREICSPFLSPADKVRLDLDEIWPFGAGVMDLQGKKMVFGITRIWKLGSEGLPHQDVLHRELPSEAKAMMVTRQFGINIYLTTPKKGGQLEIWNRIIEDEEWRRLGVPGSYGFSRDILPSEPTVIEPEAGDLIVINTQHVHAIKPVSSGDRITTSGFMAYFGDNRPIELWS